MSPARDQKHRLTDWAVAGRPLPGQTESGDLHMVECFDYGALLAVVDGVGHGAEATSAAKATLDTLRENPRQPIISLIKHCHAMLTLTRGAVMSIACLNALDDTVTWTGVGNVEGRLLRIDAGARHPQESILLRGGVVGHQLPVLHATVLPIASGDLLIFATDGIKPSFADGVNPHQSPQRIADGILARHFKGNDDALVLVVRHLGLGRK